MYVSVLGERKMMMIGPTFTVTTLHHCTTAQVDLLRIPGHGPLKIQTQVHSVDTTQHIYSTAHYYVHTGTKHVKTLYVHVNVLLQLL